MPPAEGGLRGIGVSNFGRPRPGAIIGATGVVPAVHSRPPRRGADAGVDGGLAGRTALGRAALLGRGVLPALAGFRVGPRGLRRRFGRGAAVGLAVGPATGGVAGIAPLHGRS